MVTPNEITAFLLSDTCRGVISAKPATVTVDGKTFPACRYVQQLEYKSGMDCVTRGEKKAGETYTREAVYVAGPLPEKKAQGFKVCFTVPGETNEWYVACHSDQLKTQSMQPFGFMYILMPWTATTPIDHYARKPYRRVILTLTDAQ